MREAAHVQTVHCCTVFTAAICWVLVAGAMVQHARTAQLHALEVEQHCAPRARDSACSAISICSGSMRTYHPMTLAPTAGATHTGAGGGGGRTMGSWPVLLVQHERRPLPEAARTVAADRLLSRARLHDALHVLLASSNSNSGLRAGWRVTHRRVAERWRLCAGEWRLRLQIASHMGDRPSRPAFARARWLAESGGDGGGGGGGGGRQAQRRSSAGTRTEAQGGRGASGGSCSASGLSCGRAGHLPVQVFLTYSSTVACVCVYVCVWI